MDFPLLRHPALRLLTMLVCLLLLPACAAKDKTATPEKVGMHIDAELEFAIAYPLDWRKERHVPWRKTTGSVTWFLPGPASAGTFEVTSTPIDAMTQTPEASFSRVRARYPGLADTIEEQVVLPAGPALRLTGKTAQAIVSAHILRGITRDYLLLFAATPQNYENFSPTAEEMLHSFQVLGAER